MHKWVGWLVVSACCFSATIAVAQPAQPKLVVGLVIDQMRWDFLYRYRDAYTAQGFKRLLQDGFSAENTLISYVPTFTAPGHAAIYTGSPPAFSGIPGNEWFDKTSGQEMYCTTDTTVQALGTQNSKAGQMSPVNLWGTTVTDELRLSNNFKSKVIGISLKDRGAILPAGHTANAAYWYDNGAWISSSYYMAALPAWVNAFNAQDLAGAALRHDWETLLPLSAYTQSTADNEPYENNLKGESAAVFPHQLSKLAAKDKYDVFKSTPFATSFTFEFAKAAIAQEGLGQHAVPDFLSISISATDYIGHSFGPNSVEIEDTYLRLDRDLGEFIAYLDSQVGQGNYTLFLTADHGVAHIPRFLQQHHILPPAPTEQAQVGDLTAELNALVAQKFEVPQAISKIMNYQLYLNTQAISEQAVDSEAVKQFLIRVLSAREGVLYAVALNALAQASLPAPLKDMLINGYNPKRSGDIQLIYKPEYLSNNAQKGTMHGVWNPYDTHIPCLFYGWGIKPGHTQRETAITDIAPTLAALLKIQMPSGSVGKVITEALQ